MPDIICGWESTAEPYEELSLEDDCTCDNCGSSFPFGKSVSEYDFLNDKDYQACPICLSENWFLNDKKD